MKHIGPLSILVPIILLIGAEPVHSQGISGIGISVNGVETTLIDASLFQFNLTLLQFVGMRNGTEDKVSEISTSGNKDVFQVIVMGKKIDKDYLGVRIKGKFGEYAQEGGEAFIRNPWWKFDFTVNLRDSEFEGEPVNTKVDSISIANGIIQHLEASHQGDEAEGLALVWGDLSLIANAADGNENGIQLKQLPLPLDCEEHPGLRHTDCILEGTLSAKVIDSTVEFNPYIGYTLGDQLDDWRLVAKARHIDNLPSASVPSPIPLPGVAIAFRFFKKMKELSISLRGGRFIKTPS